MLKWCNKQVDWPLGVRMYERFIHLFIYLMVFTVIKNIERILMIKTFSFSLSFVFPIKRVNLIIPQTPRCSSLFSMIIPKRKEPEWLSKYRSVMLDCVIAKHQHVYVMLVQRDSSFSSETKLRIYKADGKQNRLVCLIYFQNNLILNSKAFNSDG